MLSLGSICMENWQVGISKFIDEFMCGWGCFTSDVLDLGGLVRWFKEDHDAHKVASSRRPRSYIGCDFKSIVVIAWGKVNSMIVGFSVIG